MEDFFEIVIRLIFQVIFQIVLWLLFFPISFLVATPIILVYAIFRDGNYKEKVRHYYQKILNLWRKSAGAYPDFLS